MQVSIESTSGLERRMTVGVPSEMIEGEVEKRLQDASKKVRINGFRKGKVPLKVVRQKFGAGVRQEVLGDAINRTFQEAVRENQVKIAGQPSIEPKEAADGKDFEYVATFEVYPEVDLKDIDGVSITKFHAEVTDADIDEMIETLRTNQAKWKDVERASQNDDRVNIDFVGTKEGEAFDGGTAEGHNLVLGSNSMIPGFEEGIVGMKAGEEKVLSLTFPDDYQVENLKGADVEFKVTLNIVSERELPELDDKFFEAFNVSEGGLEAFKADVKVNMEREKDRFASNRLKSQVLNALMEANEIDVPSSLINGEVDVLRQQAIQQYGQLSDKLDVKALLPDELFIEKAKRRTTLGLLVAEVVTRNAIKPDQERLTSMIDEISSTYEDPRAVVDYYRSNRELMAGVEAAVLEDQVVDFLLEKASIEDKTVSYQELIKPEANEQ